MLYANKSDEMLVNSEEERLIGINIIFAMDSIIPVTPEIEASELPRTFDVLISQATSRRRTSVVYLKYVIILCNN
jgi:hypothetical protein